MTQHFPAFEYEKTTQRLSKLQSTGPDFPQNVDFVVQLLFSILLFKFQKAQYHPETSLDYLFICYNLHQRC